MSHGQGFTDGLIGGFAFGGLLGAADRIAEQNQDIRDANQTILKLVKVCKDWEAHATTVANQRDQALRERDWEACRHAARRVEIEFLIGQLCKECFWAEDSQAVAELRAHIEKLSDDEYARRVRAMGYTINGT